MAPLVVSLESVPAITDPEEAIRSPELAVLSARAHGEENGVVYALYAALMHLDKETGTLYTDYALATLLEPARKQLEDMLATGTYEFQSDFFKRQIAEEVTKGQAESVLLVLDSRGIEVSEEVRERILACTDRDEAEKWIKRAATAQSADELFD
ncbi:hypothetical protein CLV63_11625 [Murinocardiopsis flavida]|uniref:Uncharacterized protein n=1 Tax=Murinocardiopsis flavida TaxID=645275 RepID=A0A2P8D8R5_9ACTN|nr:hypothetical protein CLV63_11625 [Murinocardiopsis flavida]